MTGIVTIADLERVMRETGVQVVSIRAPTKKGCLVNVRETEMTWWDRCKPQPTVRAALESYFGTGAPSSAQPDDLEDLL